MENAYIRPTGTLHGNFNLSFDASKTHSDNKKRLQQDQRYWNSAAVYPTGSLTPKKQSLQLMSAQNSSSDSSCLTHKTISYFNSSSMETYSEEAQFEEIFRDAQIAIILLYTFLCLVAVVGNCCALYVVVAKRRMRNVTNYFVASLAVSDILLAVFCIPFSFVANVLFNHWPFGAALCPTVTYMQGAVVFQNSYTMLAMSLERYIAIMHPFLRRLGKRRCLQVVAVCWVLAFLTPIPTAVTSRLHPNMNSRNETYYTCLEKWNSEKQRFSYTMTIMVLQYFVPLAVLIYTYAKIVHIVWLKDMPAPAELINQNEAEDRPREKEIDPRKKVIKMMITVVGIYGVCWLPLHLITIAGDIDSTIFRPAYMRVVWITSHWLAMSSCAYNPFIYYWMNPKFRDGFISMFGNIRSAFSLGYSSFSRSKQSAASVGSNRCVLRVRTGSGNQNDSRRLSGTQVGNFTGTYSEGNRKCDTLLLMDHHGNDKIFAKDDQFVPKLSKISEVTDNITGSFVGNNPHSQTEKHTDLCT